jgi:di/tricarboxylate transporter
VPGASSIAACIHDRGNDPGQPMLVHQPAAAPRSGARSGDAYPYRRNARPRHTDPAGSQVLSAGCTRIATVLARPAQHTLALRSRTIDPGGDAMNWDIVLVLAILVGAVALFISEKYPIDLVALMVLGTLLGLGLVTPAQGISGFSNPATVTVAAMFVLSAGLQKTGAAGTMGRLLVRYGRNHFLALIVVMGSVGVMSAFINNTAAVAVFIPLVMIVANKRKIAASRLLIPLSYASQFGGVCTLIGTSTNLLVSAISDEAGFGAFSMFEFSRMGLILFVAGFLFFLVFGRWLLPERQAQQLSAAFELGEYITELRIGATSPLIGKTVQQSRLSEDHDITVLRLLHGEEKIWAPLRQPLAEGDVLLVRGSVKQLVGLRTTTKLELNVEFKLQDETLQSGELRLVQALVAPGSKLVGQTLKDLDFRNRYKGLVLAVQRRGEAIRNKLNTIELGLGDALLIQAPDAQIERLRADENFIVLDEVEDAGMRRHKVPLVLGIITAVVGLAALNIMPILVTAVLGCLALVLTGCLDLEEAYAAIDWKVIFLLAGILPLGLAMQNSGAAPWIAESAIGRVGGLGPIAVLAVFYLLTSILTEAMSNNAAAVLLAPIAISTAQQLGIDPRPLLMAITFAASTGFSTPVGYQTNTMIFNPGGYKYTDFLRTGVPLSIIFWILSVIFIPRFWSF